MSPQAGPRGTRAAGRCSQTTGRALCFSLAVDKSTFRRFYPWRNRATACSLGRHLFRIRGPALIKENQLHREFLNLEQAMRLLDMQLADALHRIRHGSSADLVEKARQDEKVLLGELDRLMTRMRAIEGQLLQIQKAATRH